MPATVINVGNKAQLASALRTVRGGETILLAPGNYGALYIAKLNPALPVTIKSADANRDAVFTDIRIDAASNFFFNDIDVAKTLVKGEALWTQYVFVSNSHDISFVGVDVHGSLDRNSWNDGWGIRLSYTKNVSIVDSTFEQLNIAVHTEHSSNLVFSGNAVRDVREGFDFNSSHYVTIAQNRFTAFTPWLAAGDHSDAIQFWNYGALEGSSHVTIRDNIIIQGHNGTQGMQIRAEDPTPAYRHSDFLIENNLYSGDSRIGINLDGVDNAVVRGNTIVTSPQGNNGWESALLLTGTTNVLVERNITPLIFETGATGTIKRGNIDLWDIEYRVGVPAASVFLAPVANPYDAANFAVRPGSLAALAHAGFAAPAHVGHDFEVYSTLLTGLGSGPLHIA